MILFYLSIEKNDFIKNIVRKIFRLNISQGEGQQKQKFITFSDTPKRIYFNVRVRDHYT